MTCWVIIHTTKPGYVSRLIYIHKHTTQTDGCVRFLYIHHKRSFQQDLRCTPESIFNGTEKLPYMLCVLWNPDSFPSEPTNAKSEFKPSTYNQNKTDTNTDKSGWYDQLEAASLFILILEEEEMRRESGDVRRDCVSFPRAGPRMPVCDTRDLRGMRFWKELAYSYQD